MNKYPRVTRAMCQTPWALLPSKLADVQAFLERVSGDGPITEAKVQEQFGSNSERARIRVGSVEIIPVQGVISQKINLLSEFSGGTSTEKLAQQIQKAVDDKTVSSILLDVDSPGGSVFGVPELCDIMAQARDKKRMVAVASPYAASAAYWIASQAHELVVAPSGQVGSIGVYLMHQDVSKAMEADGVATTYIQAGKYKTEGNPYAPLTEEALANLQEQVDSYYDMFVKGVARGRGASQTAVRGGFGQGRMVMAADAVKQGMADRVGTFDATLGRMLLKGARQSGEKAALNTVRDFEAFLRDEGSLSNREAKRVASMAFEGRETLRDGAEEPAAQPLPQDVEDQEGRKALRGFIDSLKG
jgi:signal peptide peptidase SppA